VLDLPEMADLRERLLPYLDAGSRETYGVSGTFATPAPIGKYQFRPDTGGSARLLPPARSSAVSAPSEDSSMNAGDSAGPAAAAEFP
jgi:hypothetical protein